MTNPEAKTFLVKLILFCLGFAAIYSALELTARQIYLGKTNLQFQFQSFEKSKRETEILFFGNSHIEKDINPQYFGLKAFNLAFSAQDLYYDTAIFKLFSPQMSHLKMVVFGMDYFSFGYDESKKYPHLAREYYDLTRIKPLKGLTASFFSSYSILFLHRESFAGDLLMGKKKGILYSLDSSHVTKKLIASTRQKVLLSSGFLFSKGTLDEAELRINALGRSQYHYKQCYEEKVEKKLVSYISDALHFAENHHMKVIFLTPPYSSPYRKSFPPDFVRAFYARMHKLLASHPEIKYFDFSSDERFTRDLFFDSDHLNYRGSEKLSKILAEEIEKMEQAHAEKYPIAE